MARTSSNTVPKELHAQIVDALERKAGGRAKVGKTHGQAEPIASYGLKEEAGRDVVKRWFTRMQSLSLADRFALARLLLKSHVEEQGNIAMAVLRAGVDELTPATFDDIDRLLDDFTSWSITDDFASGKPSITAVLLERYPKETLRLHARWVKSPNRWKRRASVVTFTRRVAADGEYVDETLRSCEALQDDPEDLVQKAVGWALKDTMRAGPGPKRRVIALVKRMRRAGIPSTVTLYAIRDLEGADRVAVLRVKPAR